MDQFDTSGIDIHNSVYKIRFGIWYQNYCCSRTEKIVDFFRQGSLLMVEIGQKFKREEIRSPIETCL